MRIGGTRRSSWMEYFWTVESMEDMLKEESMYTSAFSRIGRCNAWTKPVMWNEGSTARIFLCVDGVI